MTDNQIELAAKLMKIVYLSSRPGMDAVAIKLNCSPTYTEIKQAQAWAKAFGLAQRGGNPFELASELYSELC